MNHIEKAWEVLSMMMPYHQPLPNSMEMTSWKMSGNRIWKEQVWPYHLHYILDLNPPDCALLFTSLQDLYNSRPVILSRRSHPHTKAQWKLVSTVPDVPCGVTQSGKHCREDQAQLAFNNDADKEKFILSAVTGDPQWSKKLWGSLETKEKGLGAGALGGMAKYGGSQCI